MEPDPEAWKKIEEILRCPVCHDMLNDAKFLPCGHTFCQSCLEQCQRHKPSTSIGMSCPMCKENSYVSSFRHIRAGLSDLPKNLIAQEIAGVVRQLKGEEDTEEDAAISSLFTARPAEIRPRPGRHIHVLRHMGGWFRIFLGCFCGITLFLSGLQEQDKQNLATTATIICQKILPPDTPRREEEKPETFLETVRRVLNETSRRLCDEVQEYRRRRKDLYRRWMRAMD